MELGSADARSPRSALWNTASRPSRSAGASIAKRTACNATSTSATFWNAVIRVERYWATETSNSASTERSGRVRVIGVKTIGLVKTVSRSSASVRTYVNDGRILDSKHPESLVYEFRNGKKTLVAAMYMMPFGSRFTDVPDVGGRLTQWHIHNDLCLADNPSDPLQKVLSGATSANGVCPAGSSKAGLVADGDAG